MLTIGDQFPRFQLRACADLPFDELTMDTAFMDMTEETYGAKWKIYLFYPKDFTFVCPTELVAFGKMRDKFFARNAQIIGCSTDNEYVHWAWRGQHPLLRNLPFPLLADIPRRLSRALAILDDESGVCMRALYIVDEKNVIRSLMVTDQNVGRNPVEVLRILDALQTGALCPASWTLGDQTIDVQKIKM